MLIYNVLIKNVKERIESVPSGVNPLGPHDALTHHFTSLKKEIIFLQPRVLKRKFPWNWFTDTWQFSLLFEQHQVIFIHYKSRIAAAIRGLYWMKMKMVNSGWKGLRQNELKQGFTDKPGKMFTTYSTSPVSLLITWKLKAGSLDQITSYMGLLALVSGEGISRGTS